MSWTVEHRRAYMREYYKRNRDWIRVNFALWYKANKNARNARRRKQYAALAPGRRQAKRLHLGSRPARAALPTGRRRKAASKTN